jgi:hypothetical protein
MYIYNYYTYRCNVREASVVFCVCIDMYDVYVTCARYRWRGPVARGVDAHCFI